MGGIHLGDYPWARPEHAALRCAMWHMSPRLEDARRRGRVEFLPLRYFDAVAAFSRGGPWAPDCVLIQTAPPDAGGYLSLGVSVSLALPAAREAPLVIAQVNPRMPRTRGNACLHRSQIDVCVEVDEPLIEYPPPLVGDVERAIGRHVAALVPDGATVQVGVGAIPQAVLDALGDHRDLALHSLLVDGGIALIERGVVTGARKRIRRGRMDIAEVMGTRRLFDFVHDNPAGQHGDLGLHPRPRGDRGARPLRLHQLGAGDRSGRPGDGGEPRRPAGGRHRRAVRLRAGRLALGAGACRSSRCRPRVATARCRGSSHNWRRERR